MHVMFAANGWRDLARQTESLQLSAVAFELSGDVREVHELLQFEERWLDMNVVFPQTWFMDCESPEDSAVGACVSSKPALQTVKAFEQLFDFCKRWMGKRGAVWPRSNRDLISVGTGLSYFVGDRPWNDEQLFDPQTLLMLAQRVPRRLFRAPRMNSIGLSPNHALHACAAQAVVLQAAFRALTEGPASARQNAALIARLSD